MPSGQQSLQFGQQGLVLNRFQRGKTQLVEQILHLLKGIMQLGLALFGPAGPGLMREADHGRK